MKNLSMKIFFFMVIMIVLAGVNNSLLAQEEPLPAALAGIDSYAEEALKTFKVPGAALAVVKDGRVIYQKGYGYRDMANKLKVTPETIFAIGSDSKAFTGTDVGILVDEGKLDLDKPLRDYMPWFRFSDDYLTENVTLRDLLTHRTGVSRNDAMLVNPDISRKEIVERIKYLPRTCPFRYSFLYNNLMYITTGLLIEEITGNTWEEFTQEKILTPLEMKSTSFSIVDSQKNENHALPYRVIDNEIKQIPFAVMDAVSPAGGINSNVIDMSHWLIMNLDGGKYKDKQIISEKMLKEVHSPQFIAGAVSQFEEMTAPAYGFGWGISSYKGYNFIRHDGSIDGFEATVAMVPEEKLGVVVLTNNQSSCPAAIAYNVIDRMLGIEQLPWIDRFAKKQEEAAALQAKASEEIERYRKPNTKPSHRLDDYVGVYKNHAYGNVEVKKEGNKLRFKYRTFDMPLSHYHYDYFFVSDEQKNTFVVKFIIDEKGNITQISVPFDPGVEDYVFDKKQEQE